MCVCSSDMEPCICCICKNCVSLRHLHVCTCTLDAQIAGPCCVAITPHWTIGCMLIQCWCVRVLPTATLSRCAIVGRRLLKSVIHCVNASRCHGLRCEVSVVSRLSAMVVVVLRQQLVSRLWGGGSESPEWLGYWSSSFAHWWTLSASHAPGVNVCSCCVLQCVLTASTLWWRSSSYMYMCM